MTSVTKATRKDKFKMSYEGFDFTYSTCAELAELMYKVGFSYYDNPYDPDTFEFDTFNNCISRYKAMQKQLSKVE